MFSCAEHYGLAELLLARVRPSSVRKSDSSVRQPLTQFVFISNRCMVKSPIHYIKIQITNKSSIRYSFQRLHLVFTKLYDNYADTTNEEIMNITSPSDVLNIKFWWHIDIKHATERIMLKL